MSTTKVLLNIFCENGAYYIIDCFLRLASFNNISCNFNIVSVTLINKSVG